MKQLWDKVCNFAKKCTQFELWKVIFKNFIEKKDVIQGAEEKLGKQSPAFTNIGNKEA